MIYLLFFIYLYLFLLSYLLEINWKLILNGLYGYFGRNNIRNSVDIITNIKDLNDIYRKYEVYNEIIIDENLFIIIRDFYHLKKYVKRFI